MTRLLRSTPSVRSSARALDDLTKSLNKLKLNHDVLRNQLGLNNAQREVGEISMRRESMRILEPGGNRRSRSLPGADSDSVWKTALQKARVPDLWQVAEFRQHCRPFAAATSGGPAGARSRGSCCASPSDITSGKNFFGKPLSGGDHAYQQQPLCHADLQQRRDLRWSIVATACRTVYAAPRVYFIPAGTDIMRVSTDSPDDIRALEGRRAEYPGALPGTPARQSRRAATSPCWMA